MKKDLDIIIYGATGFTGQLCVKYLQSLNTKVKWAIAGRNKESLKKVSKDCYAEVEIFIADSHDTQALDVLTLTIYTPAPSKSLDLANSLTDLYSLALIVPL